MPDVLSIPVKQPPISFLLGDPAAIREAQNLERRAAAQDAKRGA